MTTPTPTFTTLRSRNIYILNETDPRSHYLSPLRSLTDKRPFDIEDLTFGDFIASIYCQIPFHPAVHTIEFRPLAQPFQPAGTGQANNVAIAITSAAQFHGALLAQFNEDPGRDFLFYLVADADADADAVGDDDESGCEGEFVASIVLLV